MENNIMTQIVMHRLDDLELLYKADNALYKDFMSAYTQYTTEPATNINSAFLLFNLTCAAEDAFSKHTIDKTAYHCINSGLADLKSVITQTDNE